MTTTLARSPMPLATASRLASRIVAELAPFCEAIEVAGAIRRQKPTIEAIDLVVLVRDTAGFRERLLRSTQLTSEDDTKFVVGLANGTVINVHRAAYPVADLFGQRTPGNFISLLVAHTGSTEHNTYLAQRALASHLQWFPNKGLYSQGTKALINTRTEEEFFQLLDLEFIPPAARERSAMDWLGRTAEDLKPAA